MTGNVFINKGVVVGKSSGGGQPTQEITQAEYDNLSQEDKMKDIIYLITDAEGGGGSSGGKGGINYSLEEQDTGLKWIDGNKIYQKTFIKENPSVNTTFSIGEIPDNIDIIKTEGELNFSNNNVSRPIPTYESSSHWVRTYTEETNVYVEITSSWWTDIKNAIITIQYIKNE